MSTVINTSVVSFSKTLVPREKHKHILTAVIYDKRNRVLSRGMNSMVKTHPKQKELSTRAGQPYKEFLHAEVCAILRCKDISKARKIVVTRIGRSGKLLLSKPCEICMSFIKEVGIKEVEWFG